MHPAIAHALGAGHFRVRERDLDIERWPFDGLRVALVADLHTGAPGVDADTVGRVVAAVNGANPDLVALLGDYVDTDVRGARRVPPPIVADRLRALRAPAFAVLGNHDWIHEGSRMEDALRGAGLCVLENAAHEVRPGLWVAGVSDPSTREPRFDDALDEVPDGAATILLAHDPDLFPRVPRRVALTLSGHTHGGQVGIPFLRRFWTPTTHGERYVQGHVEEDGRHLYVSRGIGFSRFPLRLWSPSEIVVLRLRSSRPRAH
jgi:predicted MPP superfamily phosphohydrolase